MIAHNGSIAYVRCCGPGTGIYVGAKLVYRAPHDDDPLTPAWSRDGTHIAFASGGVWTMRANGSGRVRVTRVGLSPTWSPDGRKIAYQGDRYTIWVVRSSGGAPRKVAANATSPAWAPDDSAILFVRAGAIWTMRTDGSRQRRLIANATFPVWSPGATHVAFLRGGSVWIAARDGKRTRPVPGTGHVSQVAWSPDGRELITAPVDRGDLTVLSTDGTNAHVVTHAPGFFHAWPAWQRRP